MNNTAGNNNNNNNNDYFEITKKELDEFEKFEKKQKAHIIRDDIIAGVASISGIVFGNLNGVNPFIAYIQLFSLPLILIITQNIRILTKLKKAKKEIMERYNENTLTEEVVEEKNKRGRSL